jgi:hypothetical protein
MYHNTITANDGICMETLSHQTIYVRVCYTNKTVVHLKFPHLAPFQDWECSTVFVKPVTHVTTALQQRQFFFIPSPINPLNAELNPISFLLALLAHHFLHVSRIRVKSLTLRLLMSYIYIHIYIYIWSAYS